MSRSPVRDFVVGLLRARRPRRHCLPVDERRRLLACAATGLGRVRRVRSDRRPQAARAGRDLGREGRPGRLDRAWTRISAPASQLDLEPQPAASRRHLGVDRDLRAARRPLHLACSSAARTSTSSRATRSRFTESAVILERLIGKLIHNTDVREVGMRPSMSRLPATRSACWSLLLRRPGLAAALRDPRRSGGRITTRSSASTAASSGSTTRSTPTSSCRSRRGGTRSCRAACSGRCRNFFSNLRFPIVTVNDLLQGEVQTCRRPMSVASWSTRRSGSPGFFDPATDWGLDVPRRGLRSDARVLGRAAGPVPGDADPRSVRPARHGRPGGGLRSASSTPTSSPSFTPSAPAPSTSSTPRPGARQVRAAQGGVARLLRRRPQRLPSASRGAGERRAGDVEERQEDLYRSEDEQ